MKLFSYFETVKVGTSLDGLTSGKILEDPFGDGSRHLTQKGLLFYGSQSALNFGFPVIGSGKLLVRLNCKPNGNGICFSRGLFLSSFALVLLVTCFFPFLFSFKQSH